MSWTKRPDRQLIDGARVSCPIRGDDVEIEQCFACGKLLRVITDDQPAVLCTAFRQDPRADLML
jgi:hypothetical protein